jgi:DNA-binding MarR family transcriptional regulator
MKNLHAAPSEPAPSVQNGDRRNGDPAAQNGHASRVNLGSGTLNASSAIHDQARELTSLFVSLTRQLLAVDDIVADLPLRQLRVCALLYDGPRSMSSLSRELGVSLSAMTQIADRLERARLVKRSSEDSDRRVRSLQLTPRGQKVMRLREEARIHRAQVVAERMTAATRTQVISAMTALLSACSPNQNERREEGKQPVNGVGTNR